MTEPTRTPSQLRAIQERGKNIVVVAGAGAGKTRVLVDRYLMLLEQGIALGSIVAITFTEKAASEMRDRVRHEIDARAGNRAASDADKWMRQREQIDSAQISTIHSLCARLLRANPVEAQVDPRFQVLEDTDAAILRDQAIDAVLAELAESGGDALCLLAEYEIRAVRETLVGLFQRGAAVDQALSLLPADPAALLTIWQDRLRDAQREEMARLLKKPDWQQATGWVLDNKSKDAEDKLEVVRSDLARLLRATSTPDLDRTVELLAQIGDMKVGSVGRAAAWDDVKHAREMVMAVRNLAKDFSQAYALEFDENDTRAAQIVFQWRTLWSQSRAKYAEAMNAQHALDFNDLEDKARSLLHDHSEVRERYRGDFACLLVDEFQDTNAAQRDIIYALASPEEKDRLFIVADGKQSIYGFRGADVSVFTEVREDIRRLWGDDAVIPLADSFRAHSRLVLAFNHIFGHLFETDGPRQPFEIAYEPMQAFRPSPEREPQIEIIQVPDEEGTQSERREREAEELARRLKQLIDEGYRVWDKTLGDYRTAHYGDIALLFRATTHFNTYEDAFKTADIPYVTLAGKGYDDRAEVRDLVQLLRALDNPHDDLALATVLRSPLFVLSDETLYRLRRTSKPFCESLKAIPDDITGSERERVEYARGILDELWSRAGRVPIIDLLRHALDRTDYLATVTGLADGTRRRGNVEKLLALARRTALVRLSDLNVYLTDLQAQEVREGEAVVEADKAVQLMSIHRAKGLEFPIVVIPDASRSPRTSTETMIVDRKDGVAVTLRDDREERVETVAYKLAKANAIRRDDAEEKRLLYVATTRAQDYLIFTGSKKTARKSYLAQILDALGGDTNFEWGTVLIREPSIEFNAVGGASSVVTSESATTSPRSDLPTAIPLLAKEWPSPKVPDLRTFTATGLEQLVHERSRFELHFLEGVPERIADVTTKTESAYVPAHIVGEMAHRAIQHWALPDKGVDIGKILEGYAYEEGLTDPKQIHNAVRDATRLLRKFAGSDLCHEMDQAVVRRHEVPFLVQWEGRMVHGALDALYQSADGRWFVVDFKSDRLRKGEDEETRTHERYMVQLAIYRHATAALFGDVSTRVHYIQTGKDVPLSAEELANALEEARESVMRSDKVA